MFDTVGMQAGKNLCLEALVIRFLCQSEESYTWLGSYNNLLRSRSDAIQTHEKVLKRPYNEELRACPGCKDLIKIASRLH